MNKTQKLIFGLGLGLVCGLLLRAAFLKPATAAQSDSLLPAQDAPKAAPQTAAASARPAPKPAVATPAPSAPSAEADGKTVLPSDGKTVLPTDGKESLPPVGERVGQRTDMIDPSHNGAPAEYYKGSNPLLTPPSPQNIQGPVVSSETR